ncbi:sigma-70 family RNA polymerase sigma factor [Tepidibacter thalassicus]|uniref:RNA polymerase sigma factor, sigma-70 family n=1 Tax=Tepidibacter thalassicus DSM 15285 TaxID=1123350 RepID=A0A1M5STW0_9FIRM|nr:sigma-70 family RNA polymerase sigma factor [Tepidibacter thalassicus]SHH41981.1 RNA polymerase sigma factor, sigma-70 family [Tepidibacter thalassicus DSM 15285]
MQKKLYEIIAEAQNGNKESMMLIINKFNLLIKKYSKKLNYDGAYSDLIINLIEIIKNIPIYENKNIKREECIIKYISSSLKYKYIKLSKKYKNIYVSEIELNEKITVSKNQTENTIEIKFLLNEFLDKLSNRQRYILQKIYIYGYTESEIAKKLQISRQAVNKTKKKALKKLQNSIQNLYIIFFYKFGLLFAIKKLFII